MSKMKTTVLGRSLKLIGMASKLAQSELSQSLRDKVGRNVDGLASQLLNTRVKQAKILAENLSQLKGAAMKAGQLLSLDSSDILPQEAIEILSSLQNSAEAVDFKVLDEILRAELDPRNYGDLVDLDVKAYASASIGQVHRSQFRGQDVALKIQYPGVSSSIDSDLAILKKIAQSMVTLSGKKISLNELFEEMSIILHQEADYKKERENLEAFSKLLSGYADYVVPKVVPELCSARVLGMSFEEGTDINQWLTSRPSMEKRQWIAEKILNLYCLEFFDWGIVQTDPNYANYRVRESPMQIVLLDFGATVRYDNVFRNKYVELLKSFASFDTKRMLETSLSFGLIDSRESDESKALFVDFLKTSVEPFLPHHQPFYFKDEAYTKRAQEIGREFTRSLKYSPPPRQLLFLHRKLGGIFHLLRKMEVRLNLSPYWEKMVGEKFVQ